MSKYHGVIMLSRRETEVLMHAFSHLIQDTARVQDKEDAFLENQMQCLALLLGTKKSVIKTIHGKLWEAFAQTHPEDGPHK